MNNDFLGFGSSDFRHDPVPRNVADAMPVVILSRLINSIEKKADGGFDTEKLQFAKSMVDLVLATSEGELSVEMMVDDFQALIAKK